MDGCFSLLSLFHSHLLHCCIAECRVTVIQCRLGAISAQSHTTGNVGVEPAPLIHSMSTLFIYLFVYLFVCLFDAFIEIDPVRLESSRLISQLEVRFK